MTWVRYDVSVHFSFLYHVMDNLEVNVDDTVDFLDTVVLDVVVHEIGIGIIYNK
jgi:hypothetical protein